MAYKIQRVDYYHFMVKHEPGEAYQFLTRLANMGLNLVAFTAIPLGDETTQLTIFPENSLKITKEAKLAGLDLEGPHRAFLVQGDDELGALAGIHMALYKADVNVVASIGVADGGNSYGYILYIRSDEYEKAAKALGV